MKLNIFNILALALFASRFSTVFAQTDFPVATINVRVFSEDGQPLAGVSAGAGFEVPKKSGLGTEPVGERRLTDKDGMATFSRATSNGYVSYGARADGFYTTTNLNYQFWKKEGGHWLPKDLAVDVLLKKIGDPVPMYARKVATEIPAVNQVIGFDLMIGDWVIPHGKGLRGDLLCKVMRRFVNWKDHDVALEITFPNEKDGLASVIEKTPPTRGSELRLPRTAPVDGYQNELNTGIRRQPGGASNEDAKPEMNYFFRVRTVLDEKGNIKSALYGKMHGDIRLDPINSKTCFIIFDSYLNPTPNDRNVEWDRSRNLATGLTDEQRPSAP